MWTRDAGRVERALRLRTATSANQASVAHIYGQNLVGGRIP